MIRTRSGFLLFFGICLVLLLLNLTLGGKNGRRESRSLNMHDDFALLLGKETASWRHVREREDGPLIQKYTDLYEKNKHLQFDATPSFKIPKVIHFVWLGPRHFPIESIENVRTWIAYHPGWTIKFWTDRERPCPVNAMELHFIDDFSFSKLRKEYDEAENWGEKSGLFRYELLMQEGGIYVDHDVKCVRSFHSLNSAYDFFSCLEMPHEPIEQFAVTSGISLLGARPNHPVIGASIDFIAKNWEASRTVSAQAPTDEVMKIVHCAYVAMTHALQDNLDRPGNTDIVFPASYFYGKDLLPSFYSRDAQLDPWAKTNTTRLEQLFSHHIDQYQTMTRRLLIMQCSSMVLLITALFLCFRRRSA